MGGWVDEWVGGLSAYICIDKPRVSMCMSVEWVGGWVGGWVGEERPYLWFAAHGDEAKAFAHRGALLTDHVGIGDLPGWRSWWVGWVGGWVGGRVGWIEETRRFE